MKKHIKLLKCCGVGICLMFIGGFVFGCAENNSPYSPPGRKTKDYFGDGRFEIVYYYSEDDIKLYSLCDRKEDVDVMKSTIESNITNYIAKTPYVYVIGKNGMEIEDDSINNDISSVSQKIYYTKLNYETGDIIQNTDLNTFSDEDRKIFEDLSNSKSPFKDK